ncbi:MAG: flagellar hook protein FlgE [Bacillota bacterium]
MMRAIYSGVSGLKAHQQAMDVIGNNVANVNTTAYKASRVTFSDIFNQTLSSATGADPTTGRGGSNAKQVGLGSQVASIDILMSRGSTETTGNTTDLAINGNGFFIVRNGTTGEYMFTRAGNFSIDENGNLTTSDGMNIYGWQDYGGTKQSDGTYKFDTNTGVEPINIYSDSYNKNKKIISADATGKAAFTGSLDSSEEPVGTAINDIGTTDPEAQYSTTMAVYDSLGNKHQANVNFTKCYVDTSDADNPVTTWYWSVGDSSDASVSGASGYLKFNSSGELVTDDPDYSTTPEINITPDASTSASAFTVELDFSNLTMTSDDSSVQTSEVDGGVSGTLDDISIDANGIIMGVYSNGQKKPLGMIGLAQFDNASGLERVGTNYYRTSSNSGDFSNAVAANGTLSSGALEMSNVDLSAEFSKMIIVQRGYQANSRIITTSDEMLEELINMKR